MEALRCPGCGGSDLERVADREYVCEHCRTRAVLSSDARVLVLAGSRCPECGFLNDAGARFCGKCGSSLTKQCPSCSADVSLELRFCSDCGHDFTRLAPSDILDMIEEHGGPSGLDLSKRDLSRINLSRDAVEAELNRVREISPGLMPVWWARFGGINLEAANLEAARLFRADLGRAFLKQANLAAADLRGAVLAGAFLGGANLGQADLRDADLMGAYLGGADAEGADLVRADLQQATLSNVNLRDAKVEGARRLAQTKSLAGAILPDGTKLSDYQWKAEFQGWSRRREE